MARPPTLNFGGPSPQSPRSPPLGYPQAGLRPILTLHVNSHRISTSAVKHIAENVYEVQSGSCSDTVYTVDTFLGHCTCREGCTGGPCKHRAAVATLFWVKNWNTLPIADLAIRRLL